MRPAESFVTQPVRSLQTMLRVIAEDDGRLPAVVPDGIYGPSTMTAVSAFQRREGLPATGITDQPTWEAIVAAYEPALIRVDKAENIEIIMDPGKVYKKGETAPYIYLLQSILIQLAESNLTIIPPVHNGILDDITATALSEFQLISNLPVTGELDKITWKHLVRYYTANIHHNTVKYDYELP